MHRHLCTPERYHTTMGSHAPALRIAPGDAVVTTTVDSLGQNATGERITAPWTPVTGPVHVEGAQPGDTLVVHLDRLVPDRPAGVSASVLAPGVVDPEFVRALPERSIVEWDVDLARNEAKLRAPISGLEGVAAAARSDAGVYRCGACGREGDLRDEPCRAWRQHGLPWLPGGRDRVSPGLRARSAVLRGRWPCDPGSRRDVARRRAHGRPAEGRGDRLAPRRERGVHLHGRERATTRPGAAARHDRDAALAGARPGLDAAATGTLLGQCTAYDVGNVSDPAYTVVCRLPRPVLRQVEDEKGAS